MKTGDKLILGEYDMLHICWTTFCSQLSTPYRQKIRTLKKFREKARTLFDNQIFDPSVAIFQLLLQFVRRFYFRFLVERFKVQLEPFHTWNHTFLEGLKDLQ